MSTAAPALLLASQSPRRRAMLAELGFAFDTAAADIDETPQPGETGPDFAKRMAETKARALARPGMVVLAADTDVTLDDVILGKPRDRAHGLDMLRALSGRSHHVHSAVAVIHETVMETIQTTTRVDMGEIAPAEAEAYWASGEPADKAGGYAIQGYAARWVRRIDGSLSGVIGLPMVETVELLGRFGVLPPQVAAA
ncbi:Maf family protein [Algiphilus sp.]|uniref:Maf family protein n=1 Tax=Algiphilus sp. TaxID=1872431 RepID=UPI0025BA9D6C|nr:Maf family protein [Algiphilus sp.]MCI5062507.1 Maf family nucleotide pyrophosphatase [Algiphilus sp.]MCI5104480.1 Maf family nucleotide pyrophosphatase [Algiphilus sp.]